MSRGNDIIFVLALFSRTIEREVTGDDPTLHYITLRAITLLFLHLQGLRPR